MCNPRSDENAIHTALAEYEAMQICRGQTNALKAFPTPHIDPLIIGENTTNLSCLSMKEIKSYITLKYVTLVQRSFGTERI